MAKLRKSSMWASVAILGSALLLCAAMGITLVYTAEGAPEHKVEPAPALQAPPALTGAAVAPAIASASAASLGAAGPSPGGVAAAEPPVVGGVALLYATAVQEGNCAEVIRMTLWMQDRLERVQETAADASEIEAAREQLCAHIQDRAIEKLQLTNEDVEDACVFLPGAEFTVLSRDAGHDDLDEPVRERVWLRVAYPVPDRALRGASGRPIRSLEVGLNISDDGCIVKAGIRGNLDIRTESLHYFAAR